MRVRLSRLCNSTQSDRRPVTRTILVTKHNKLPLSERAPASLHGSSSLPSYLHNLAPAPTTESELESRRASRTPNPCLQAYRPNEAKGRQRLQLPDERALHSPSKPTSRMKNPHQPGKQHPNADEDYMSRLHGAGEVARTPNGGFRTKAPSGRATTHLQYQ
jgi:hypothetical protein